MVEPRGTETAEVEDEVEQKQTVYSSIPLDTSQPGLQRTKKSNNTKILSSATALPLHTPVVSTTSGREPANPGNPVAWSQPSSRPQPQIQQLVPDVVPDVCSVQSSDSEALLASVASQSHALSPACFRHGARYPGCKVQPNLNYQGYGQYFTEPCGFD
ncbi:hypothetical protein PAAG_07110 [Paracoccidioides lutzii Pb01]|uniref:Uncharacterized protein n=1 Tax=Paracoccidioides lutzii (strain ATCC MYA-826 / Pb01) TaxID=502779 RepID=C1H8L9_PARBA|nr:hypothetical protein PAAG_07110 [Paracoccidioides lutzii Pb01]EEH36692.2 hypothetical protein PAAG_07110 [Paracoccidioides lutzii Pb01]